MAEESGLPPEVELYWRARRATRHALVVFLVGVVAAIVFRRPQAWGDGELARTVQYASWMLAVVGGLVAFRMNATMAEHRGFCRGKLGVSPVELRSNRERSPR